MTQEKWSVSTAFFFNIDLYYPKLVDEDMLAIESVMHQFFVSDVILSICST